MGKLISSKEAWAILYKNSDAKIDVFDSEDEARYYATHMAERSGRITVNGEVVRSFSGCIVNEIIPVRVIIEQVEI